MVRLKVTSGLHPYQLNNISIPYGAIKSFLPVGTVDGRTLFQFLMVRLKERRIRD